MGRGKNKGKKKMFISQPEEKADIDVKESPERVKTTMVIPEDEDPLNKVPKDVQSQEETKQELQTQVESPSIQTEAQEVTHQPTYEQA